MVLFNDENVIFIYHKTGRKKERSSFFLMYLVFSIDF